MAAPRCARLVSALRGFQLPPEASVADLRKSYLREAKRLHPDARADSDKGRATKEFADLRSRFDETLGLLQGGDTSASSTVWEQAQQQRPPWADGGGRYGWNTAGGSSSSTSRTSKGDYKRWDWEAENGPHYGRPSRPVVGFPPQMVYTATSSIALVAASLLILWFPDPRDDEMPHDVGRLRHALEAASVNTVLSPRQLVNIQNTLEDPASSREPSSFGKAHAAAQDGAVWWIERCGATSGCRETLDEEDSRGDTPLHHSARRGSLKACSALLRAGADPTIANLWRLWPDDLAAHEGHHEMAQVLRGARLQRRQQRAVSPTDPHPTESASSSSEDRAGATSTSSTYSSRAWLTIGRHPDGLGMLSPTPDDVLYTGPYASESLRHAVNLAAGHTVLGRLRLDRADPKDNVIAYGSGGGTASNRNKSFEASVQQAAEFALERVRGALSGTGVELEEAVAEPAQLKSGGSGWRVQSGSRREESQSHCESHEVSGLLVFEPPGAVSPDAPGHWHAVRPSRRALAAESADDDASCAFFRLDSVRGSFRLTDGELAELVFRYRTWRVIARRSESEADIVISPADSIPLAASSMQPVAAC